MTSDRGRQLAALRALRMTAIVAPDGIAVAPGSLKAVLRTIDDHAREESTCWASTATIAAETCLCEKSVRRCVKALESAGFITASDRSQGKAGRLSINWEAVRTSVTVTEVGSDQTSVTESTTSVTESLNLGNRVHNLGNSYRQTDITENTTDKKRYSRALRFEEEDSKLAGYLISKILEVAPKIKRPNLDHWSNTVRLMREADGHSLEEIRQVFDWAISDSFWRTNILLPEKLRKQFGNLHARMKSPPQASYGKPTSANVGPGQKYDPDKKDKVKWKS